MDKTNKHFISGIDKELAKFDRTHNHSLAQQEEIEKYKRIYQLRDQPAVLNDELGDIWD